MPEFMAESPIHAIMVGALLVFGCIVGWITLKRKAFIWSGVVIGAVSLGLVIAESVIVTDSELINSELDQMAACVRNNDVDGLLKFISKESPHVEAEASIRMGQYMIELCRITSRARPVFEDENPARRAKIRFIVFGRAKERATDQSEGSGIRGVELSLQKEDDGVWRVTDYLFFIPGSSQL